MAIEYHWVNNRSLTPAGRQGFLLLIGASTLMIGGSMAVVLGAWPVLLFSFAHVVALWLGFRGLALHDQDYERLTITDWQVLLESRDGRRVQRCQFNRAWVQLLDGANAHRHDLALRYCGKRVAIGRLMDDERRAAWARELRLQLALGRP